MWRLMSMYLRRSVALIASLLLFAGPGLLFAQDDAKPDEKSPKSPPVIAHIRLRGDLDETPTAADPLFGGSSENFQTRLDRIAKAKDDANVKALYLEIGDLTIGWGKLDELRR